MFSLFLPPKTVSAVRLYGDEAVFRRFCIFFISFLLAMAKKAQTEYSLIQKTNSKKSIENRSCYSVGVYRIGFWFSIFFINY